MNNIQLLTESNKVFGLYSGVSELCCMQPFVSNYNIRVC